MWPPPVNTCGCHQPLPLPRNIIKCLRVGVRVISSVCVLLVLHRSSLPWLVCGAWFSCWRSK